MVWYSLPIGKWKIKYTPLEVPEKTFESCDKDGNILTKISGSFTKGHFINEATGEKHDKAFKLVNGKPTAEFKSRIDKIDNYIEVNKEEAEDLLTEKHYLVENFELYEELVKSGKAFKFGAYFGRGFKAYRTYLIPSPLYKGFLEMKAGRGQKSEVIREIVGDLAEDKALKQRLEEVELTIQKVNRVAVEELILI